MSTDTVPARSNGQTIEQTWFNILQAALSQEFCPRNSSGVPTEAAGSLGSETYEWLKVHVLSGGWRAGDIKAHHSYNAAAGPGHGWMLCDGRVIAEAAYNTEHGASTWATYIGTSPLDGKYLPNLTNKYLVGKATTTQTGGSAITGVGNTSHQIAINHTHVVGAHTHVTGVGVWHDVNGNDGVFYDSAGTEFKHKDNASTSSSRSGLLVGTGNVTGATGTIYGVTDSLASILPGLGATGAMFSAPNTDSMLSATQSIQPESIEVQFYMRIIT